MYLLGLDLGTSSLKAVLLTPEGKVVGQGHADYLISRPHPGWAEQDPEAWWQACRTAISETLPERGEMIAVGLSGQMHGIVLIDADGRPVYPAIIWPDQRSAEFVERFEAWVPRRRWPHLGGPLATGFAALSLLWLARAKPEVLAKARWILQPKDYLRYRLTGKLTTEATDASGTFYFDVSRRNWDWELSQKLGIASKLPTLVPSTRLDPLSREAALFLGLPQGLPVTAGMADQPAAAYGNGVLNPPVVQISLSSGGQIFAPLTRPETDPTLRVHVFAHVPDDRWYRLAAVLNVGLALNWVRQVLAVDWAAFYELASTSPPGSGDLLFLPYLSGERTPYFDPRAMGGWIGIRGEHTRADLARAALEGVSLSLRDAFEALMDRTGLTAIPSEGEGPKMEILLTGGGTRSPLWRQLLADVLGRTIRLGTFGDASAYGAALLAGVASGVYPDHVAAARYAIPFTSVITPDPERSTLYTEVLARFRGAYAAVKPLWQ